MGRKALLPGVYTATLTFFDPATDEVDTVTLKRHVIRLAEAGVRGIVTLGSNGEAVHLSNAERNRVTKTTSTALLEAGYADAPVITGCSGQSVKETVALCKDAAQAGASHALVLPPCYFKGAMTEDIIYDFYMGVAKASPIPIVIYSFPAVTAGIEMNSDLIIRISKELPNIVGTKFTCGDSGKLARVARAMHAMTPKRPDGEYWAVAGLADFTLQALVVGGSGTIAGGANILPKTTCKVYDLYSGGKIEEAMQLQSLLAEGDWPHTAAGIGGTKAVLQQAFGYGGVPRAPLKGVALQNAESLAARMKEIIDYEKGV